jgi:hypothetical protein
MSTTEKEMIRAISELAQLLDIAMGAEGDCLGIYRNEATDAIADARRILDQFVAANKKVNE